MSVNQLIFDLKENNEDFEFYPSTKEMIEVIYNDADDSSEWLDIGCGTCNFKKYFNEIGDEKQKIRNQQAEIWKANNYKNEFEPKQKEGKHIRNYYVMEKSRILINQLDSDTICLGTDFNNTLLLDKPVKNIFCNPPYSEFDNWTKRILLEGNFVNAYLIIPVRWKDNEEIQKILKDNHFESHILGTFDFLNAERNARAVVNVVKFEKEYHYKTYNLPEYRKDAFDRFFDEFYYIDNKKYNSEWTEEEEKIKKIKSELVSSENKAEMLVKLYNQELETLHNHFKAIASLDADTLDTIGIKKKRCRKRSLEKESTRTKSQILGTAF